MDDEPKVTELMVGRHVVGLMTNCYIVGNRDTREAICIDPCAYMSRQTDEVAHLAADLGVKIKLVIATHGHHDHVVGVGAMKERIGAPFLIHRSDLSILKEAHTKVPQAFGEMQPQPSPDGFIRDGNVVEVSGVRLRVIWTPGHTPGSVSFFCEEGGMIFSGDTLFKGTVGWTSSPKDYDTLMQSITTKLFALPPRTRVLPGHENETAVMFEKSGNFQVNSWMRRRAVDG